MKANEYVKQNGWTMARKAVAECTYGYGIDLDELKRLVKSHDRLKEEYGTLKNAKEHLKTINNEAGWNSVSSLIADVESCQ